MSGGRLVVVDRAGRDVKRYTLAGGLATLGSDPACDIRVMQPHVAKHHATVVVHAAQTVVRNVGEGSTLVNGRPVSVAALRHGDVITVGDRALRWEYAEPRGKREPSPPTTLAAPRRARGSRAARRASAVTAPARDRALQLALELQHRASMPGSTGGKQVAVVQPQRRDTNDQADKTLARASPQSTSRRTKPDVNLSAPESDSDKSKRKSSQRTSPKNLLQTTKATLWIESRKSSPRKKARTPPQVQRARKSVPAKKSTPLRLTVLKKAQSARKVVKIEEPLKIDYTKRAAIMLMTGHTPKSKLSISPKNQSATKKSPSYVIKKPSPVRKTPRGKGKQSGRGYKETGSVIGVTPSRGSSFAQDSSNRNNKRNSGNRSVTILEISDSTQNTTIRASNVSTRSGKSPRKTPSLSSPKKSAMKDHSKKSTRKTESIKFDLSNLSPGPFHRESRDVLAVNNASRYETDSTLSEEDLTLHYSESSNQSPSPRKSIHSRSSRMLEKVGTPLTSSSPSRTLTTESPRARNSIRGSAMVRRALASSDLSDNTKDQSSTTTVTSAFRTRTLSPRSDHNLESYSVVDLVSFDSNDTSKSVYDSAGSIDTTDFGTPANSSVRKTRSTINPTLIGCSTPYVGGTRATRSKSSSNINQNKSIRSTVSNRRSKSLSTPENKHISVNSTKISRASRSRSRINDSDLLLLDETEVEDSSPKTSKRSRTTKLVTKETSNVNMNVNSPQNQGISTPENRYSPEAAGTPVLSIQSLLDSSQSSLTSQNSGRKLRGYASNKRKTVGVLSEPKRRQATKTKPLGSSVKKTWLRLSRDSAASSDKSDEGAPQPDNEEMVTPKSAVKISPEAVKNKHSTAKKPLSKRSIIDNLNQSDIVKQLFNSPVKRKLSQSMTEFSRKQLFDDDDIVIARRLTRNTVALTGRTPDNSLLDQTGSITPERFVSPINMHSNSPNFSRLDRFFRETTAQSDLNNVRGVRSLPRTPSARASIRNDLTNLHGVNAVLAKSPGNRLSDVRVKEMLAASQNHDLRRVSGVKSLFQTNTSPENDLTDVRGVKRIFRKSPENDLRNVSGVKRTLRNTTPKNDFTDVRGVKKIFRKSPENDLRNVTGVKRTLRNTTPRNDLTDMRGVRRMFRQTKQKENYHDVSGIEELFNESNQSVNRSETLFDMIIGKRPVKSVYSKTFSTKLTPKPKTRQKKTLHSSIDVISNNVDDWLEQELQKRLDRDAEPSASASTSRNNSKNATIKELKKLATDTVGGGKPICLSRTRNSSYRGKKSASEIYSAHTLPIKKRSFVEVSLEKSKHQLPIKKRAVVHSTPVKGRVNFTMNASELGRVSPIAALGGGGDNTSATRSIQIITDEKAQSEPVKVRTPRKQETPKKIVISKPSPKKSPEKQSPPKRVTRNRKITESSETNAKKRRNSLVISKKAPVMSPKSDPKIVSAAVLKEASYKFSPKKTRATRRNQEGKIETPKKTRARATRATVIVAKPSPKLKPQPKEKVAGKSQTKVQVDKSNRTRKNTAIKAKAESQKVSPKINRRTRANTIEKETQTKGRRTKVQKPVEVSQVEKPLQAKRGRKTVEIELPAQPKRVRKTNAVKASIQENTKTRGNKSVAVVDSMTEKKQPRGHGKKIETQESVQSELTISARGKKTKPIEEAQPKTRGRNVHFEAKSEEIQYNRRGKKIETQTIVLSEPVTRSRRNEADETVATESKGRKRKANEEIPSKVAKPEPKRGKKADTSVTETGKQKRAKKASKVEDSEQVIVKSTSGMRLKKDVKNTTETKPVRGRKEAEPKEKVEAVRGKRKAIVEPSLAKVAAKKRATKASVQSVPSPAATRARATGGKPQTEVASKTVGRSRRR